MLAIDPAQYRLVDLSVEIEPPGSEERPLEVSVGRLADDTYKMDISKLHSHVGTHVEAPYHFFGSGKLITDMPLESFFGPAALLSVDDPADSEVTGETLDREVGDIIEMDWKCWDRFGNCLVDCLGVAYDPPWDIIVYSDYCAHVLVFCLFPLP